jgi:serine phosphatase RsbU (regulator of sigma subunit)
MYDTNTHELTFTSAGHNKPVVYRKKDNACKLLKAGGLPLGMDDNEFFETTIDLRKTSLEPGDFFFQFTDGVNEAMNATREQYGNERLYNFIQEHQTLPSQDLIQEIALDVQNFTGKKIICDGPSELNDDIAMIGLRRL